MAVDWDQYDLGKVAIAILIPVVCVAFWWLGSQQLSLPVQQNAIPSSTPSVSVAPEASPSVEPQPSSEPTDPNGWRPIYSSSGSPEAFPSPVPTPKKTEYAVDDLQSLIPVKTETSPYGFSFLQPQYAGDIVAITDLSRIFANSTFMERYSSGFVAAHLLSSSYSNGTVGVAGPSNLLIFGYDSPSNALQKVRLGATGAQDFGSANMGDASVLYRIAFTLDSKQLAYYKVAFAKKNVLVILDVQDTGGEASKQAALDIARIISDKI